MKKVDRRVFLKGAGLGSLAPVVLGTAGALEAAQADWTRPEPFAPSVHVSFDIATEAQAGFFQHQQFHVILSGAGKVSGHSVSGSGRFVIFDQFLQAPKPLMSSGTWQARKLNSATVVGSFGGLAAGVVDMQVRLSVAGQKKPLDGRLLIVTNLSSANLFTGLAGRVNFSIAGTDFAVGGGAGPFVTGRRKGRGFFLRV
jgi:hypothetical protein